MIPEKKYRNSRQREVILEELRKLKSHPTAAGLHKIVRNRLPKISLGTVYRNLDLLVRRGTIVQMDVSGPEKHFDGNPDRHYHICCVECGRIDDLHHMPDHVVGHFESLNGYRVIGHHLQFKGICPGCRADSQDKCD